MFCPFLPYGHVGDFRRIVIKQWRDDSLDDTALRRVDTRRLRLSTPGASSTPTSCLTSASCVRRGMLTFHARIELIHASFQLNRSSA